jgi:hypothetical protein
MKWLIGLLLLCATAAQAQYQCLPRLLGGSGTYYNVSTTADAVSVQWVCATPTGDWIADLTFLKSEVMTPPCALAYPVSVLNADPLVAANTLQAVCMTVQKVDGHYNEPAHDAVYQQGLAATRALYAVDHPPPPPDGPVYRTPASGTFRLYTVTASGTLGASISGRTAQPNQLCDCTLASVAVGSSRYCALSGGVRTEATYCVKVGP